MPELLTPRLRCSPLQLDDWSFFLSLQQDPQVMLYVADNRPIADIRAAFDARLPLWSPKSSHWLCLCALCDYAFSTGGIRRLTASVTAGNLASKQLLLKTGFIQEGELRESYWLHGRWHNDWLFGLMRHDYQ